MHDINKQSCSLWYKKQKPKVVSIFRYDSKIMIKFQIEVHNLAKLTHFEKFIFIQQWLTQNMWSFGQPYVFLITNYKIFQ